MDTCMGIFTFMVVVAAIWLVLNFFKTLLISTIEVRDFLANFNKERPKIFAAIDRFARYDKPYADTLKKDLEQLCEDNIPDRTVLQILFRGYIYSRLYLETIDINSNYELWKDFFNSVVKPLHRYYYLYKANQELRGIVISNDRSDAKTRELLYTLSHRIERISKRIEDFSKNYDGYFDKEGFDRAIDRIRTSQSLSATKKGVKRLIKASNYCAYAYYFDGNYEWTVITFRFEELASIIDALK